MSHIPPSGQCLRRIGTHLKDTRLMFPMRTMEAAGSAFRANTIAAAIIVVIRRSFHQCLKRQWASFRVHFAYLHFCDRNRKSPGTVLLCAVQYLGYPVWLIKSFRTGQESFLWAAYVSKFSAWCRSCTVKRGSLQDWASGSGICNSSSVSRWKRQDDS